MMSGVELVSLDVDPSLQLSHVLALLPDQADARSRSRRLLLGEVSLTLHGGGTLRWGERTSLIFSQDLAMGLNAACSNTSQSFPR